jgi:hypothetical protein
MIEGGRGTDWEMDVEAYAEKVLYAPLLRLGRSP